VTSFTCFKLLLWYIFKLKHFDLELSELLLRRSSEHKTLLSLSGHVLRL